MGFLNALVPYSKSRRQKQLQLYSSRIKDDITSLADSFNILKKVSNDISECLEDLKSANFEKRKEFIDSLKLSDKYKENLRNEIEHHTDETVKDLENIQEISERMKGNYYNY